MFKKLFGKSEEANKEIQVYAPMT
ncbi:TPA: PTS glucose transporter subunit IIA, partial [Staphylococcus pseudintermedius]|nr:PTS glucose transporter subunit IIA [Staphylococcus pseudintermedius]